MTKLNFSKTLEKLKMDRLLLEYGTVIVGYSGGADSSCLLYLLNEWCRKNGVVLAVAHINHMIRGKEADRDEEFCRRTAAGLGITFYSERADVPRLSEERGTGLEETARDVRYAFFDRISEELTGSPNGAVIATAHNASDNLETVLMNMMRGTGLHGMSGIQPIRDGRIIRPLINDSGDLIRAWCRENGIEYVIDSTNAETDCTRNTVRHMIVPVMRELCASPEDSVSRMTSLLREDDAYLNKIALEAAAGKTEIGRETLNLLARPVASRVLMMLYNNAKNDDSSITEIQIEEIIRLSREKGGHSEVSLPGNLRAVIERDIVSVSPNTSRDKNESDLFFEYTGGNAVFENGLYRIYFSERPFNVEQNDGKNENIYKLSTLRSFNSAKIRGTVKIRYKRDGDSYVFCGHTHKLKKLFTDAKLTEHEKRLTPVFTDDDGIFWAAGFGTRDGVKLESGDGIHILVERLEIS